MPKFSAGDIVQFVLDDVFHPDVDEVLRQMTPATRLAGRLLFVSDARAESDRFAVIDVEGIRGPAIVAVDRLTRGSSPIPGASEQAPSLEDAQPRACGGAIVCGGDLVHGAGHPGAEGA